MTRGIWLAPTRQVPFVPRHQLLPAHPMMAGTGLSMSCHACTLHNRALVWLGLALCHPALVYTLHACVSDGPVSPPVRAPFDFMPVCILPTLVAQALHMHPHTLHRHCTCTPMRCSGTPHALHIHCTHPHCTPHMYCTVRALHIHTHCTAHALHYTYITHVPMHWAPTHAHSHALNTHCQCTAHTLLPSPALSLFWEGVSVAL